MFGSVWSVVTGAAEDAAPNGWQLDPSEDNHATLRMLLHAAPRQPPPLELAPVAGIEALDSWEWRGPPFQPQQPGLLDKDGALEVLVGALAGSQPPATRRTAAALLAGELCGGPSAARAHALAQHAVAAGLIEALVDALGCSCGGCVEGEGCTSEDIGMQAAAAAALQEAAYSAAPAAQRLVQAGGAEAAVGAVLRVLYYGRGVQCTAGLHLLYCCTGMLAELLDGSDEAGRQSLLRLLLASGLVTAVAHYVHAARLRDEQRTVAAAVAVSACGGAQPPLPPGALSSRLFSDASATAPCLQLLLAVFSQPQLLLGCAAGACCAVGGGCTCRVDGPGACCSGGGCGGGVDSAVGCAAAGAPCCAAADLAVAPEARADAAAIAAMRGPGRRGAATAGCELLLSLLLLEYARCARRGVGMDLARAVARREVGALLAALRDAALQPEAWAGGGARSGIHYVPQHSPAVPAVQALALLLTAAATPDAGGGEEWLAHPHFRAAAAALQAVRGGVPVAPHAGPGYRQHLVARARSALEAAEQAQAARCEAGVRHGGACCSGSGGGGGGTHGAASGWAVVPCP